MIKKLNLQRWKKPSKKGFEFKEATDIMLFDPERLETEINKLP